jgi:hypothetical protein
MWKAGKVASNRKPSQIVQHLSILLDSARISRCGKPVTHFCPVSPPEEKKRHPVPRKKQLTRPCNACTVKIAAPSPCDAAAVLIPSGKWDRKGEATPRGRHHAPKGTVRNGRTRQRGRFGFSCLPCLAVAVAAGVYMLLLLL